MGSRGASSMTDMSDGGGRGGIGKDWDRNHPANQAPSTLKEAIGDKGLPLSMTEAYKNANPFYSDNYREFSENCQRAVVAYELRRRGYNVTAQPTFENDKLPKGNRWQGSFKNAKKESIGASTTKQAREKLNNKMKEYGNGSRAIVSIQWKSGDGHVFNVERRNGKNYYIDAQTGKRYRNETILNGVKPQSVKILRTDNLRVSDRAKKAVWTRGA